MKEQIIKYHENGKLIFTIHCCKGKVKDWIREEVIIGNIVNEKIDPVRE